MGRRGLRFGLDINFWFWAQRVIKSNRKVCVRDICIRSFSHSVKGVKSKKCLQNMIQQKNISSKISEPFPICHMCGTLGRTGKRFRGGITTFSNFSGTTRQ